MKKMERKEVFESIEKEHNLSWFEDIYKRNKNNTESVALFFRGNKYTYNDFFKMVFDYANALKKYGIKKGDEFVACLKQTPDYPALVAAASLLGATCNLICADFDKGYITEIIEKANSGLVFVDDWDLNAILNSINNAKNVNKTVVIPVSKWDKYGNQWKEITDRFYKFNETEFKNAYDNTKLVEDIDKFLEKTDDYTDDIDLLSNHATLDDVIAITYTSGSTKKGFHKGVPQRNKTYIIMGRYHDPEVAGIPKMKNTITNVAIGPHADTCLLTGVSDTLIQGGTVALDPIIDEHYFVYSLLLNKTGLCIATRSYWMTAMKDTYRVPELKGLKLPGLYVPSEGGEPMSAGEEKALNKWLKDVKAGTDITHTPTSVVKMSIGGGDSENGSLFLRLFRGYYDSIQKIRGIKEPMGMEYYNFADVEVLREDGTFCNPMERGRLVANSPLSMDHYHNDLSSTKGFYITDATGKTWRNLGCYGYKDKWNNVYMKGRIKENDPEIKTFEIADVILRDTKNIMSCEVVEINNDSENPCYVAHIEPQYFRKVNTEKMLKSSQKRLESVFGDKLEGKLLYRIHSNEEGFPLLFTAKRNLLILKEEGDSKAISLNYMIKEDIKVKTLKK